MTNFYFNMFNTGHVYFPAFFDRFNLRIIKCICNSNIKDSDYHHYLFNCNDGLILSNEYATAEDWKSRRLIMIEIGKKLEKIYSSILTPIPDAGLSEGEGIEEFHD
jgi:hypothetical protein